MAFASTFLRGRRCVLSRGETKTVTLVAVAGGRVVQGGSGLIGGALSDDNKAAALERAKERGFLGAE